MSAVSIHPVVVNKRREILGLKILNIYRKKNDIKH